MVRWQSIGLAARSLVWAALLPGLFAGYMPWRYFGLREVRIELFNPVHLVGLASITIGVILLAACIWEFATRGRGTLSPLDPPRHLVVRGLYRYLRNPMYLSVTAIVLGEVLLTRSRSLFACWIIWFVTANLFVRLYEEPALRSEFGAEYDDYCRRVGRWLPKLRPG